MSPDELREQHDEIRLLTKRIEVMLLEAGATIDGDEWAGVFIRKGESVERLTV